MFGYLLKKKNSIVWSKITKIIFKNYKYCKNSWLKNLYFSFITKVILSSYENYLRLILKFSFSSASVGKVIKLVTVLKGYSIFFIRANRQTRRHIFYWKHLRRIPTLSNSFPSLRCIIFSSSPSRDWQLSEKFRHCSSKKEREWEKLI